MAAIGIDLGTCFSSVSYISGGETVELRPDGETRGRIPSAFYHDADRTLAGSPAQREGRNRPQNLVEHIKKQLGKKKIEIGGAAYTPEQVLRELFQYLISGAEESLTEQYQISFADGMPRNSAGKIQAVLTVPVKFSEARRQMIRRAASEAVLADGSGPEILEVIPEPVAAAMDYLRTAAGQEKDTVMIYDLGGGTFDAAILRRTEGSGAVPFEVAGQDGKNIGGTDFDMRLLAVLQRKLREAIAAQPSAPGAQQDDMPDTDRIFAAEQAALLRESVQIKEELSEHERVTADIPVHGSYYPVAVTREEFEAAAGDLLEDTLRITSRLLERYQAEHPDAPVQELILVGGSSRMPMVERALAGAFPDLPRRMVRPELAISNGAAWYAQMLITSAPKPEPVPVKSKPEPVPARPVPEPLPVDPEPAPSAASPVRIGIDFGTGFCFIGMVHGGDVVPLVKGRAGMPTIFYHTESGTLVGAPAERRAVRDPEHAVASVKMRLNEEFPFPDHTYSSEEIVTAILQEAVSQAEQILQNDYHIAYDGIEAVLTVPARAFGTIESGLVRRAAEQVVLQNGRTLAVLSLLSEPCAAAVQYFGMSMEKDQDILVYDLGAGTCDCAIVHANAAAASESVDGHAYVVVDQEGADNQTGAFALGGNDFDRVLAFKIVEDLMERNLIPWIPEERIEGLITYRKKPDMREHDRRILELGARACKEDLTEAESAPLLVQAGGEQLELEISREMFETATAHLLSMTMECVERLLARNPDRRISHVILTGGGSNMPQVLRAFRTGGLFPEDMDIRLYQPQRAVAFGAARYADAAGRAKENAGNARPTPALLRTIAPHGYGIKYWFGDTVKIRRLIRRGQPLPAKGEAHSKVGGRTVHYEVYECDALDDREYLELAEGRLVLDVECSFPETVPDGSQTTEYLMLNEKLELQFHAENAKRQKITEGAVSRAGMS